MRIFIKALKILGYVMLSFLVFGVVYFISAFTLSRIGVKETCNSKSKDIEIYILSNGVHTDIVTPIKTELMDWSRDIKFENTFSKDSSMQFLAFGWGDKGFYLDTPNWSQLKFSVAFKAMFHMGTSAMHATFYKKMKENEHCRKILICREDYRKLTEYIKESFQQDENGNVIHIKDHSYGKNDSFYEAQRVYSMFYTCNTWANNGLKSCGQKACFWTPFDTGILNQYKK